MKYVDSRWRKIKVKVTDPESENKVEIFGARELVLEIAGLVMGNSGPPEPEFFLTELYNGMGHIFLDEPRLLELD